MAEKEQAHERQQVACYEIEYQLTEARQQLSEKNVEAERTRGRLASQVKESGAIEQRIAQAEKESQELGVRLETLDQEIANHKKNLDALEAQTAQSRDRMIEINQQREALQGKVRERERAIEAGRQLILRLLGEASTLKNQLAQIDEYLAGIERETARSTREEQIAAAEIERLETARKQLSETMAQRQLELETVTGERRRTEEDLAERRRTAAELRREIDGVRSEVSQIRARKESLEQVLAHRTYTTDSVKRLFASLEKGKAADLKPLGVLADYVEVDRQFEKPAEEFLHEELEYVVVESWEQAERGLDFIRAELDGRATFLVHPEDERQRPGAAARAGHRTGDRHRGAAERIAAADERLQGPRRRSAAARVAVLPRGGPDGGATALGGLSAPVLPAAGRRLLSRPHGDGRQEIGRRSAGDEARGARAEGEAAGAAGRAGRDVRRGWTASARRSSGSKPSWSGCARCSSRARRTASRSITTCASWARICRAPTRGCRWRGWNWSGCAATRRNRRSSGSGIARRSRRRNGCAREREEALEAERQELEKLEGQAATIGEEHAATRAELAGLEERHRGERSGDGAAGAAVPRDDQPAQRDRAGDRAAGRTARAAAGRQHRAGSAGRRAGRADHASWKRASTRWRRRTPGCARRCAPARRS